MNQLSVETIKKLVASEQWKILKRDVLIPFIERTADVTKPVMNGEFQVEGAEAYYAKLYTVQKLKGLIKYIEKMKNIDSSSHKKLENYK